MILSAVDDYIFRRCSKDFEFYCEYTLELESPVNGSQPFLLFDYQRYVTRLLDKKKKLIVVTPRQMGFTTLMAAKAFWEIQTKQNINVVVVVARQWHVKHFMGLIDKWISKGQYFNAAPPRGTWNAKRNEITCIANNSTIRCVDANSQLVHGTAIDMLIMLDFAFHLTTGNSPSSASFFPCLKPNAKVAIISTPASTADGKQAKLFKKIYCEAKAKKNLFYPYRVSWWARPGNTLRHFADIVDAFGVTQYDNEVLANFD